MLKALELAGFKSFADKTRFEFPEGITVIVGPNGSGKSNIVDAIKWVLGAQSAKALRGKDMADVIFKGSGGTSGRKAANTAEATIIIDNADNRLPYDATEVHITRRVYRSGEGEYLINGQACRLKDIRDLFRGTGVGADAYSLIEQGKVDQMLQATPKDRRAIFEEAAGISRFKAKKMEAQRRLERVDQNLLRLSDIVDEVGSRLNSVRSQAGKARRYREYSERLQALRTHVGMADWRRLTEQITQLEAELSALGNEADEVSARGESIEARTLELEIEIADVDETIRDSESRVTKHRERIAAIETTIGHERSRRRDLEDEQAQHRQRLASMSSRAGDLHQRLDDIRRDLQEVESSHETLSAELNRYNGEVDAMGRSLEQLREENRQRRTRHVEQMRVSANLGNEVSSCESQLATTTVTESRCSERLAELQTECESLALDAANHQDNEVRLSKETEHKAVLLEDTQRRLEDSRKQLSGVREELSKHRLRHSAASERVALLQELEEKLDGVGAGVKEVIAQSQIDRDGPFTEVRGLVADLFQSDIQYAAMIDIALGEISQAIVVDGHRLIDQLCSGELELVGKVGFFSLTQTDDREPATLDLTGEAGVLGRADELVRVNAEMRPLARRLLGETWIVADLATAWQLRERTLARFVTMTGELVEHNGMVVVGAADQSIGLVSRRSELLALEVEIRELQQQMELVEQEIDRHQAEIYQYDQIEQRLSGEHKALYSELTAMRTQAALAQQRFEEADGERSSVERELESATRQLAITSEQLAATKLQLTEVDDEIVALESRLASDVEQLEQLETQFAGISEKATTAKVHVAKSEQKVQSLRAQRSQFEEDQQERDRAISETSSQLAQCLIRQQQADRTILQATSELSQLYLAKEESGRETLMYMRIRGELSSERSLLSAELQKQRKRHRKLEAKRHEVELAAGEIRHERTTLDERLKEDYGIEIAKMPSSETEEEERQREEIEQEIVELRRKINNIGAVNVDALSELDDLESRFESLNGQYQDLNDAKDALGRIINKINADSRRLFVESLEAIRTNFQALYRQAFGGGRADLVLEEDVDVLEAGIDIIATPPGKPEFSNSLLSGGEKALTAVSLLLAIFQCRPSPFCVLDEVDAPFDEANIGRFINVLNDFLGWTKFVIVTHSKKTMTAATTLYGVTMQESGVSKQVSVQFEDVSDDGHISAEAIQRHDSDDADAA